jgi:hypothetical protein
MGEPPVVIATEVPENTNTSITNVADGRPQGSMAVEVLARYLPHRLEEREPTIWIEEYPPRQSKDAGNRYSRVTFSSSTPRVEWCDGVRRITLGEPSWQPIAETDMLVLIGDRAGRSNRTQDQEERDADRASYPSWSFTESSAIARYRLVASISLLASWRARWT